MTESVLIVGAGSGLSASLGRVCASKGMRVVLAARNIEKLQNLKKEIGADTIKCDATNIKSVTSLFKKTDDGQIKLMKLKFMAYLLLLVMIQLLLFLKNN